MGSNRQTDMKISAVLLVLGLLVGQMAAPAEALSCIQPEPIDWSERFPQVEAAAVGVVESVKEVATDDFFEALLLEVRITETLHGRIPSTVEYAVSNFNPWGPYYEVGQELAIVVENGRYVDGNQELCGPWFGPHELRSAAAEFGGTPEQPIGSADFVRRIVEHILRLFVPWFH